MASMRSVLALHAGIAELAVVRDSFVVKAQAMDRQVTRRMIEKNHLSP